jgi:hypothetical protein
MPTPKKCSHTIFAKNCTYCTALQRKWYDKAQKGGTFEDIEKNEDYLKTYSSDVFRPQYIHRQAGGWQAKAEYYNLAQRFLNEYKFAEEIIKVIWSYHCEGISAESISGILKKLRYKRWSRINLIKDTIKQHKHKMFDMYLAPRKDYHE